MMISTGLAVGLDASPQLAGDAVRRALRACSADVAHSVLLFLSADFAHDPKPALLAAQRAAQCTQVAGCTAFGILTEEDWVLDSPAAAAMVFCADTGLVPAPTPSANQTLLTLAAPNALDTRWLAEPGKRFGGVSGDATGHGPFKVWGAGSVRDSGHYECSLTGLTGEIGVSLGFRQLGPVLNVDIVDGYDLIQLSGQRTTQSLKRELPLSLRHEAVLPLPHIKLGVYDSTSAGTGTFRLISPISDNGDSSITVAAQLKPGDQVFWALRQSLSAEEEVRDMFSSLAWNSPARPAFGMLFSCAGRGPGFYGGEDRDFLQFKRRFPGMPLIGLYGNGQIAPTPHGNRIIDGAVVAGLFSVNR